MAIGLDGIVERTHEILSIRVGSIGFRVRDVVTDSFACDGEAVAVKKALVEECLEQRAQSADPNKVRHVVLAAWLEVAKYGYPFADFSEVV
jgi:hypothetical protein